MMEKPRNYDEVQGITGEFEKIRLGGHKCKVIKIMPTLSQAGRDMLAIYFDIAEGENKNFYTRKFEEEKKNNENATYKGIYRILTTDKDGNCNKFFKGFFDILEKSNEGYKWDWNEESTKGKMFGGLFGREEYLNNKNEYKFATKLVAIRMAEGVEELEAPDDKLLDGSKNIVKEQITDDDLPF